MNARERLVTLAHSLPADKTLRDPQHGELNRLLDAIEAEARAPLLAELTAARALTAKLRWGLARIVSEGERYSTENTWGVYPIGLFEAAAAARALLVSSEAEE